MAKKPRRSSATTVADAVGNAAASTAAPSRNSRHRAGSSAADAAVGDLSLLLALYQSLLGQLGTNLDGRRVRDDLQVLRNRAWDQVSVAQQQLAPAPVSPVNSCLLADSVAYFADLLLLTHRLVQRFPADQPPPPPPALPLIPCGLQESQRVPGGHHHGRMSSAALAAAAATAAATSGPWNPLSDADRARCLAERLRLQQQPPPPPSPTSDREFCLQQQQPRPEEETWSALIRADNSSEDNNSLDSYVCRHEPVLLEIHAGPGGRRRRCAALVAVVLLVVVTFAVVLGICITMLTPRRSA